MVRDSELECLGKRVGGEEEGGEGRQWRGRRKEQYLTAVINYCKGNVSVGNKIGWGKVKQLSLTYGFGDAWLDQVFVDEKELIKEFVIRITDYEMQTWSANIKTVPKLQYYCM